MGWFDHTPREKAQIERDALASANRRKAATDAAFARGASAEELRQIDREETRRYLTRNEPRRRK